MRLLDTISLVLAFVLSSGCSSENGNDFAEPSAVTLLTRAETATTVAHRLLVFGEVGNDACLLNHSFVSGDALKLDDGSYRFVTLTATGCFDLPAAGVIDGVSLDRLLPLKENTTLQPVMISAVTKVETPDETTYIANLHPATCLLKLELKNAPADLALELQNMAAGLSLSGSYSGAAKAYPLKKEEDNLCLPTVGNAIVQYASEGKTQTLEFGMPLESGYTYSARLQWNKEEDSFKILSKVEMWLGDSNTNGEAD